MSNLDMTDISMYKITTNEEMVADLMRFSPYGALGQIFIIEAIRFYSNLIAMRGEPEIDPSAMINPKIWYQTAVDVQSRMKAVYERNNNDTQSDG